MKFKFFALVNLLNLFLFPAFKMSFKEVNKLYFDGPLDALSFFNRVKSFPST